MMNTKTAGFTLVELLVVIAIIGILASIGYPNYIDKVQKSRRADAKGVLTQFAGAMERYFTVNNTYSGAAGTTAAPADTGAPRIFATQSPIDGTEAYYNLTINAVTVPAASGTAAGFTIYAAPTGKQTNDPCGTLTLDNTGKRGIILPGTTTIVTSGTDFSNCW